MENVKTHKSGIIMLKSYLRQYNVVPHPPPHNNILFELDLNVKFPLFLLQFLSDLKSTIIACLIGYEWKSLEF